MLERGGLGRRMGEGVEVEIQDLSQGGGGCRLTYADPLQHWVEIAEGGIHLKAERPGGSFGRGAETGCAAHQVGALGGLPHGQERPGCGPGHGAVVTIRDGAQRLVDALNEFGKIERELARGVGRAGIHYDHRVPGKRATRDVAYAGGR